MNPKVAIVIPTYTRHDKLKECLQSIANNLDETIPVYVVANGASDDARAVCRKVNLIWFDEPMGYPRPVNVGIKAAIAGGAEFVVLLNDDALFLPQPPNECIDVMLNPMLEDETIGLTGPLEEYDPNSDERFLIFFCVMIRAKVFDSIGYLDETFKYFGEDTDFCIKAQRAGWGAVRVPVEHPTELKPLDPATTTLEPWKHNLVHTGNFRIFHDAESTIGHLPDSEEVLRESREILQQRYGKKEAEVNTPTNHCTRHDEQTFDGVCVSCEKGDGINIFRASVTDGWFGVDECSQLARWVKALPPNSTVVEVGSWHGRSTRAIADNLSEGSKLIAVDTWLGSSGEPEMHGTAHYDRGDHAHQWWWDNLHSDIMEGRVIPMRMHSENAAHSLSSRGVKIDLLFVDADHSLEGFKTDITKWAPMMKEGSLWCGHDYYPEGEEPFAWIGVRQGVQELFPDAQKVATSLWWSRSQPLLPKHPVFDCFPFNDELDLLEMRLTEMDAVVDRFVITESPITYTGQPKPLYFEENKGRFEKWLDKITHIVCYDMPRSGVDAWTRERWQRDALMRGLTDCRDTDVILISDVDEIPNAETVAAYRPSQGLCRLKQRLFYGYMNCENRQGWDWLRITPYKLVKERTPCGIRYPPDDLPVIADGGWHFSFMGGPEAWKRKLECTAHQEYNTDYYKDAARMEAAVLAGRDMLDRAELSYAFVPVDGSFPKFVRDNVDRFIDLGFIRKDTVVHPESYQFVEMVKAEYPQYFTGKKVLEVGSLDINGSVRQFFTDCDYTGIDIAEGNGVDYVSKAHEYVCPETHDVVISSEMLEHDKFWQQSLKQMYDNLKAGGLLAISCAGPARPEHGTTRTDTYSSPFTTDYYRNISKEDLLGVLPSELFSECTIGYARGQEDLHFWGVKLIRRESDAEWCERNISKLPTLGTKKHWTVTAEVSTKDRYETTLPMCLTAIITQTRKPDKLVIYDDGEQADLREMSPFKGLFGMCDELGIKWEIFATPRKGQVTNHQHCLDMATTDFILRCDDDVILLPDCLERLLNTVRDHGRGGEFDNIGAVAGLIHHPGSVAQLPDFIDGSLNDVQVGVNMQWYEFNSGAREVDHLYSSFLFSVAAARKAGGYPKGLSQIGHREETIFSHSIKRAGFKLLVDPWAKAFHLRESTGGIRSFTDLSMWDHDEQVFQSYLTEWGVGKGKPTKLVVLDAGIGDHFAFKSILPKLREIHADKELVLAVCFPQVFEGEGLKLISIADAKTILGERYEEHHAYKHFWETNNQRPLTEAMLEFWS